MREIHGYSLSISDIPAGTSEESPVEVAVEIQDEGTLEGLAVAFPDTSEVGLRLNDGSGEAILPRNAGEGFFKPPNGFGESLSLQFPLNDGETLTAEYINSDGGTSYGVACVALVGIRGGPAP